jgi:hypothetical protein
VDGYIQTVLQNVGTPHNTFNIAYHTGSPASNDPFYLVNTSESNARKTYYGASGVPYTRCDGGYCGFNVSTITSSINGRLGVASPLLLDVTASLNGSILTVTCIAQAEAAVGSGHALHVVLLDHYTHLTNAPSGQEDFYHAMRDMAPSSGGQSFTALAGQTVTKTATFTLSSSWTVDDLDIACFVQNTSSKSVLQAHCETVQEALTPPPPPVNLTLTPVNPPLQIPAGGGSFSFRITLATGGTGSQSFDFWTMQRTPSGSWQGPLLGPVMVTLPAGVNVTRARFQNVPSSAAAGTYTYSGYVGDHPAVKWDSSSFTYAKLSGRTMDVASAEDWSCGGELFPGEAVEAEAAPPQAPFGGPRSVVAEIERSTSLQVSPNPFNPTTTITLTLPQAGWVEVGVYDLAGRNVGFATNSGPFGGEADLQWREAGSHTLTFDGSRLPSGVYLYRVQAGGQVISGKMMLVK